MPKQYKLEKVVPFTRPAPPMPAPEVLALGWLNAQAGEGWRHDGITLTIDGETATLGPTSLIRDEPHLMLVSCGTSYEYKLEKLVPFVRPMPQMPDPVEMAIGWLNSQAEAGWEGPAVELEFAQAGPMETVALNFAETVDVRGEAHILFRRAKPSA